MAGAAGPNVIDVGLTTLEALAGQPAPGVQVTNGNVMDMAWLDVITHSGPIGVATLAILLMFSVVSWAIIVQKSFYLRRARRESERFLNAFWDAKRLDQMYQQSDAYVKSPVAQVFRSGYVELARLKKRSGDDDLGGGIENVERALRRSANAEATAMESMTAFLATVGSTSPFIGLFGTVWGIMKAFQEIGRMGSANLATVAPGISEALIATAAGLAAAIPAVIAYNFFLARIRVLNGEMEAFSADFLNIVKRHFFK
ncbi:MAG: protein TolQ [Myxococcota bacterium]